MKNILITGGGGFVGSHLCNAFLAKGYNVYTVDDLSNGDENNISNDVKFEKLDLSTDVVIIFLAESIAILTDAFFISFIAASFICAILVSAEFFLISEDL